MLWREKQGPIPSRTKAQRSRHLPHAVRSHARHQLSRIPLAGRFIFPDSLLPPIETTIPVDTIAEAEQETILRWRSGLIGVTSGHFTSGSDSSRCRTTSLPPRAPSPAFDLLLRRDARLVVEEEEYAALHGQRPVYTRRSGRTQAWIKQREKETYISAGASKRWSGTRKALFSRTIRGATARCDQWIWDSKVSSSP